MPRHLRRRFETLIPVSLRLLDESGRHRIAEPMLGIAVEVSASELLISVMGRAGRPLSYGLARKQKVVVSFLATELHEKVESLVCDFESVTPISGQPDAWHVRLRMPALMPDLAEEIIAALQRYGRRPKRTVSGWAAAGLALGAAFVAWGITSWSANSDTDRLQSEVTRLHEQLAFSNRAVDQLAQSLEQADRELDRKQRDIDEADQLRTTIAALEANNADLQGRLDSVQKAVAPPNQIQMRGVSLTDFRTVRTIRGAATAPRLAFHDGTLALIAARPEQRRLAQNAGRLLTVYAQQRGRTLSRRASWSLESADGAIGVETQEAFVLGDAPKDRPDFVFEARGPADTWLAAYARIGIQEVWTWYRGRLEIRRLTNGAYTQVPSSNLLPGLDPALLARFIEQDDQISASQEFAKLIR